MQPLARIDQQRIATGFERDYGKILMSSNSNTPIEHSKMKANKLLEEMNKISELAYFDADIMTFLNEISSCIKARYL